MFKNMWRSALRTLGVLCFTRPELRGGAGAARVVVLQPLVAPLGQRLAGRRRVLERQVLELGLAGHLVHGAVEASLLDLEDLGTGLESRELHEVRDFRVLDLEGEIEVAIRVVVFGRHRVTR